MRIHSRIIISMAGIYEEERTWMLHGWKWQQNQRITGEVEAATTTEAKLEKSVCSLLVESTLSRLPPANRIVHFNFGLLYRLLVTITGSSTIFLSSKNIEKPHNASPLQNSIYHVFYVFNNYVYNLILLC